MTIKDQILDAMKAAMRSQDKPRLEAIRLIQASIKQVEVDQNKRDAGLDDSEVLGLLDKMLKQRRDSITQYQAGNRQDLADKEQFEITIIQEFLPQALSAEEVDALIQQAMTQADAKTMADMGKVMAILKPQIQGRADAGAVSARIKALLG